MSTEAQRLLTLLAQRGWMLAVAESLTGGLLSASIVDVPGASAHFRGGVVSYATDVKQHMLGVDAALLAAHGAVHPEVARQMALGVCRATAREGRRTEVGIATTGIAGPDSPDGQPVGTVHIGIVTPEAETVRSLILPGTRAQIRTACVEQALAVACAMVDVDEAG